MLIHGLDDLLIPNRPSWLNHGGNPCACGGIDAITKWEKGIGSHHAPFDGKIRFHLSQFHRINPAHLAGANADGLGLRGKDNGIRLDVLADFPGKIAGLILVVGRLPFARHG